eukprot:6200262-Pleurochrysis_carterae.AAC.1
MEAFGDMAGHACLLLCRLALLSDAQFPPGPFLATPSAISFAANHAQSILLALHSAVARQILVFADYGWARHEPQCPQVAMRQP